MTRQNGKGAVWGSKDIGYRDHKRGNNTQTALQGYGFEKQKDRLFRRRHRSFVCEDISRSFLLCSEAQESA